MAGKAWCCGGGSSGGGGGGGLAAVTTADTPTVDLSGDGTAGAPLSAAVLVAPEPNGVEAAANGLLVAPSADAGNTLAVGSDGRLFVPPDTTDVLGLAGSPPVAVGTSRSVGIDVTESPAGTFTVGARLSPVYGDGPDGSAFYGAVGLGVPVQLSTVTVPETGIYEVFVDARAVMNMGGAIGRNSFNADLTAQIQVNNSTVVLSRPVLVFNYSTADNFSTAQSASTLLRARVSLNAGDSVQAYGVISGTAFQGGDAVGVIGSVSYVKISD